MSGLYFLIGLVVFWLAVITLTYAVEKRLVWPFVPAADLPPERVPPAGSYSHAAAQAATENGFTWLGTYGDGKSNLFRIRYDVFRSPTGEVLSFVGVGTVASLAVQTTWLHTLLSDGRRLVTIDHQTGGELDLSGLSEEKLMPLVPFSTLLAAHRARTEASGRTVEPFSATDAMGDLMRYRRFLVERLERNGDARFLDREREAWRYSPKGALRLGLRQYTNGLRRRVVPDSVPAARR